MIALAFGYGACNGRLDAVGTAAISGAQSAVELCIAIGGPICLWAGVMELMREGGLTARLARLLRPILNRLFPAVKTDMKLMETISANVAANVLGLGNAATPLGMAAASELGKRAKNGVATAEFCTLLVLNTASLQLIPTTIAAVRASAGAAEPFDILPAVWVASAAALAVGLTVRTLGVAIVRRRTRWN